MGRGSRKQSPLRVLSGPGGGLFTEMERNRNLGVWGMFGCWGSGGQGIISLCSPAGFSLSGSSVILSPVALPNPSQTDGWLSCPFENNQYFQKQEHQRSLSLILVCLGWRILRPREEKCPFGTLRKPKALEGPGGSLSVHPAPQSRPAPYLGAAVLLGCP